MEKYSAGNNSQLPGKIIELQGKVIELQDKGELLNYNLFEDKEKLLYYTNNNK